MTSRLTIDFYEGTASDVKAGFNTSSYSHSRVHPHPMGVNKKVIGLIKDELGNSFGLVFWSSEA